MKNFLLNRKIQFYILTIFFSIITISATFIICYTYIERSKSIVEFSKGAISRAAAGSLENISCLTERTQRVTERATGLFKKPEEISSENKDFIAYLFDVLRVHPHMQTCGIALSTGLLISATNLPLANQTHYLLNPTQPLPKEVVYSLRIVNFPSETWHYKDKNFQTIASETVPHANFNPVTRPWYLGAVAERGLHWTNVYNYNPTGEPGLTVSCPLFDTEGKLFGVAHSDLSLKTLSQFLTEQTVANLGNVFLLDNAENVLAPTAEDFKASKYKISMGVALTAYAHYTKDHQANFSFTSDGRDYLTSMHTFPLSLAKQWTLIAIVPLKSLFGDILTTQNEVALLSIVILLISGIAIFYFSKRVSSPIVQLTEEFDKIRNTNFDSEVRVYSYIKEISLMDSSLAAMRIPLRSFGRYVPKEIIKQLSQKGQPVELGGEKKSMTLFFSNIVNFIPYAKTASTEELTLLLSEYFEVLSRFILEQQGTIDKYLNDSIMAFWGAPLEVPNQAHSACISALLCQAGLSSLNTKRKESGKSTFLTHFGIHSGEVIVGNIGTLERMNYTVIGDAVNAAARIQHLNENYRTSILITKEVQQKLGKEFLTRPLDIIAVRGKKEKSIIYELVALSGSDPGISPTQEQVELCTIFTEAYDAFHSGNLERAKTLFLAIHEKFPNDYPTEIYLERLKSL